MRVLKALVLMVKAHKGQTDKGGRPYWRHPFYVARHCKTEPAITVALLHDTLEDTDIKASSILDLGQDIYDAVNAMTHKPNEEYSAYIQRVKTNTRARQVKIQDLKHNLQITRLKTVTAEDQERLSKYETALKQLQ